MAKFKVGDVVSVEREAAEMIGNPALARKRGRVTKVLPGGYYEVDGELGATGLELTDAELILANYCRSTNAVVAKALYATRNACGTARNAGAENQIGKRFGNVEVSAWDFDGNRYFKFGLGIPFNDPSMAVGKVGSKEYAISKAKESLKRHRQDIADIEKGIEWLKAAK